MKNKIAIVGPGAAGKNVLARRLELKGFRTAIMCTTRPIREGEIYSEDYYYLTKERFNFYNDQQKLMACQEFNGWHYGLYKTEFEISDVIILSANAIKELDQKYLNQLCVIYLDIPEKTRKIRLTQRNDADTVERRIASDREQFKNFDKYDVKINNANF